MRISDWSSDVCSSDLRGFVLHDGEKEWDSSLVIGEGLYVTTSRDVLEAMARGEGPARSTFALGCAGWGAGQLEYELTENSWLTVPADAELLFAPPLEIGRAHVCTPVPNAHLVCRLLLEKKTPTSSIHHTTLS